MQTSIVHYLIVGVIGLLTGAIGSLIAPWVHWGIEKRRIKLKHRRSLIKEWREILQNTEFNRKLILECPTYGVLQENLTMESRKELERSTNEVIISSDSPFSDSDKVLIQRELVCIEKKWGLI